MKQAKKVLAIALVLVLTILMIPVTNVSAATKTQKKNYNKIVKALKRCGDYDGKWWSIEDYTNQYLVSTNGKKIEFSYISSGNDNIIASCKVSISKKKLNKMKVEYLDYLKNDRGELISFNTVPKTFMVKKYNYRNYSYKYKFSDKSYLGNYDTPNYDYIACKVLNNTMKEGNDILKRSTGYKLKILGFKKCR